MDKIKLYYDDGREVRCGDRIEHLDEIYKAMDDDFSSYYVGIINYEKGTFSLQTDMGCLGDVLPEDFKVTKRVEEDAIEGVIQRLNKVNDGLLNVYGGQVTGDVGNALYLLKRALEGIKGK